MQIDKMSWIIKKQLNDEYLSDFKKFKSKAISVACSTNYN